MKNRRFFAFMALVLALFFLSQFAVEFFSRPGQDRKPPFSLSGQLYTDNGFAWLEAGIREKDDSAVNKSIFFLRKALRLNPLNYQARYYLAKGYLQLSTTHGENFQLAVDELTAAARIRGSNQQIALDCGRLFFSLWPLLDDQDRTFATALLANVMPATSWTEFIPLLEMWSLYVRDAPLLMELLQRKPEFFGPAADWLVAAAIPLQQRRELLNLHEIHTLDALERRYNEMSLQGSIDLDKLKGLYSQLRQIKGYFRLQPKSLFQTDKLARLQRFLLLEIITKLLSDPKTQADPKSALQAKEYIQAYLADHSELPDLDALRKVLEENKYFKDNDFSSLYLKTLISYRQGNYGDVIREIEALRQSISFVKKEQLADYTAILLLLIDSYYSSKLMTSAEAVASELYQNQPDNPDVLYRMLKIESILGPAETSDQVLKERLAKIKESRLLTLEKPAGTFDVYLLEIPEIEIVFSDSLRQQLNLQHKLLQVFVDNKIAFEDYCDTLPEKIVIGQPFTAWGKKVRLQVLLR